MELITMLFIHFVNKRQLQDITTSKDYFKRKVDYVQEQMDKIDSLGRQKSKVLNAVIDVIEMKVAAIQAQQQQQAAK